MYFVDSFSNLIARYYLLRRERFSLAEYMKIYDSLRAVEQDSQDIQCNYTNYGIDQPFWFTLN